jgi:hypothetical protein
VKETYNYPDGAKRTVEKREIKSDGTPGKITPPDSDVSIQGVAKAFEYGAQFLPLVWQICFAVSEGVVREPLADGPTLNTLHSPFSRNGADTIS